MWFKLVVVKNVWILFLIVFNKWIWCLLFNLFMILFSNNIGYFFVFECIKLIFVNLIFKVVVCCWFCELYVWIFWLLIINSKLLWWGFKKVFVLNNLCLWLFINCWSNWFWSVFKERFVLLIGMFDV